MAKIKVSRRQPKPAEVKKPIEVKPVAVAEQPKSKAKKGDKE